MRSWRKDRAVAVTGAEQTWQVVDVAAVHQQVSIFGVTERRKVPGQGHAGADVPPQRTSKVQHMPLMFLQFPRRRRMSEDRRRGREWRS